MTLGVWMKTQESFLRRTLGLNCPTARRESPLSSGLPVHALSATYRFWHHKCFQIPSVVHNELKSNRIQMLFLVNSSFVGKVNRTRIFIDFPVTFIHIWESSLRLCVRQASSVRCTPTGLHTSPISCHCAPCFLKIKSFIIMFQMV